MLRCQQGQVAGVDGRLFSALRESGDGAVDECRDVRSDVVTRRVLAPVRNQARNRRIVAQSVGRYRPVPRSVIRVRPSCIVPLQLGADQKPHRSPQTDGLSVAEAEFVGCADELLGQWERRDADACTGTQYFRHPGDLRKPFEDLRRLADQPGPGIVAVGLPRKMRGDLSDHQRQQRRLVGHVVVERHRSELKFGGERPHAQSVDSVAVEDTDGRVDDAGAAQRLLWLHGPHTCRPDGVPPAKFASVQNEFARLWRLSVTKKIPETITTIACSPSGRFFFDAPPRHSDAFTKHAARGSVLRTANNPARSAVVSETCWDAVMFEELSASFLTTAPRLSASRRPRIVGQGMAKYLFRTRAVSRVVGGQYSGRGRVTISERFKKEKAVILRGSGGSAAEHNGVSQFDRSGVVR